MIRAALDETNMEELARLSGFELAMSEIAMGSKLAKKSGMKEFSEIFDSLGNWFYNRQCLENGINRLLKLADDEAIKIL